MKKKMIIIGAVSLFATAGLGASAGIVANEIIMSSNSSARTATNAVQLNTVITNSVLGNVYGGKTITPNTKQLNSLLAVQNPLGSSSSNGHPNQGQITGISIVSGTGAGSATVTVVDGSPDYDTTTGNVINISGIQNDPTTLIDLGTAMGATSDTINLNTSYSAFLNTQTPTNIASLKGDAVATLKGLDGTGLYNNNLDINQIQIDTTITSSGLQGNQSENVYEVALKPIDNSNMYTGNSVTVKFNVTRINFSSATEVSFRGDGDVANPTESELYSGFMGANAATFGSTDNISISDVSFGSYQDGGRTLTVNSGNEYGTGSTKVSYTVTPGPQALDTVVPSTQRALGQLNEVPTFADFMCYLDKNLSAASLPTILGDGIVLPGGCTGATIQTGKFSTTSFQLTPVANNSYYTGNVTITGTVAP